MVYNPIAKWWIDMYKISALLAIVCYVYMLLMQSVIDMYKICPIECCFEICYRKPEACMATAPAARTAWGGVGLQRPRPRPAPVPPACEGRR
jgi:hypothetical protein